MPERDDFSDLHGLARFGAALDAAARRPIPARRRWLRGAALSLVALLGVSATAAATVAALRGTVIPAPDARILPADQASLQSSTVLAPPRSADPAGGPPWALRLTRTQTEQTCTTVGQVRDGVFGIVGQDQVFRQIPPAVVDACGRGLLLGSRIVSARTATATRSIVYGVAGSGVRRVTLITSTARRRLVLGERGAFVAALRGYPEDTAARVELIARDGSVTRRSLGARPELVPDFGGAAAWRLVRNTIGTRQLCARIGDARRPSVSVVGAGGPERGGASAPTACVSRRASFDWAAQALRLRPGQRGTPGFDRWSYQGRPPRTLLLGVAKTSMSITRVTVTGAGAPRVLTPTRSGLFALLLPVSVDPADLRLTVDMRDGSVQRGRPGHGIVADVVASRRPR